MSIGSNIENRQILTFRPCSVETQKKCHSRRSRVVVAIEFWQTRFGFQTMNQETAGGESSDDLVSVEIGPMPLSSGMLLL